MMMDGIGLLKEEQILNTDFSSLEKLMSAEIDSFFPIAPVHLYLDYHMQQ